MKGYINKWYVPAADSIYDDVSFYCPICKEKIYPMYHLPYTCGCGTQWISPPPISNSDIIPIREINGGEK